MALLLCTRGSQNLALPRRQDNPWEQTWVETLLSSKKVQKRKRSRPQIQDATNENGGNRSPPFLSLSQTNIQQVGVEIKITFPCLSLCFYAFVHGGFGWTVAFLMNSLRENGNNVQNLHREVAGSPSTNSWSKQIWNIKQVFLIISRILRSMFHLPTFLNALIFLEYCLSFSSNLQTPGVCLLPSSEAPQQQQLRSVCLAGNTSSRKTSLM